MEAKKFTWTGFYTEFADKLLPFNNKREELLRILMAEYDALDMRYPFIDGGEVVDDICPFTESEGRGIWLTGLGTQGDGLG